MMPDSVARGGLIPTGVDHLRTVVEHHVWATLTLLDRCLELAPEELALSIPGTFGSIHATLEHLVRSDRGYLCRINGRERPPRPRDLPPLAALRADMERQAGAWRETMARVDELDARMPLELDTDPPYPEIEHAVGLFILQALHHGEEHRTHVRSILGAHALEVPELSGWEYVRLHQ
jgi:uncharacterized damage-inducible protein DinB